MPVEQKHLVDRTKKIETYVNAEEYEIIRRMAEKEQITISEYARMAMMFDACLTGNRDAWRIITTRLSRKAKDAVLKKVEIIMPWLLGKT